MNEEQCLLIKYLFTDGYKEAKSQFAFKEMIETAITTGEYVRFRGKRVNKVSHGISNSGPTLRVAPRLLAIAMLERIRSRFP